MIYMRQKKVNLFFYFVCHNNDGLWYDTAQNGVTHIMIMFHIKFSGQEADMKLKPLQKTWASHQKSNRQFLLNWRELRMWDSDMSGKWHFRQ